MHSACEKKIGSTDFTEFGCGLDRDPVLSDSTNEFLTVALLHQLSYLASRFYYSKFMFSVTRRYRSDVCDWLTDWVSDWVIVRIDWTDVTLVSDDTYRRLYWCDPDHPDESYLVMKVI